MEGRTGVCGELQNHLPHGEDLQSIVGTPRVAGAAKSPQRARQTALEAGPGGVSVAGEYLGEQRRGEPSAALMLHLRIIEPPNLPRQGRR